MRISEILEPNFVPKVSVHLDDVQDGDLNEIAGMLRGLMCAIEGWGPLAGLSNEHFSATSPVILTFSSVENAHYFKSCVEYYFSSDILDALKVKKRAYRS